MWGLGVREVDWRGDESMRRKLLGVLAGTVILLAACGKPADQTDLGAAERQRSVHTLVTSSLFTSLGKPVVKKEGCIGPKGQRERIEYITLDPTTIAPGYLQKFHLTAGEPFVQFYIVPSGTGLQNYYIVNTPATGIIFQGGDVKVIASANTNMIVNVYAAIVDSSQPSGDSTVWWWSKATSDPVANAAASLGGAVVGSAQCKSADSPSATNCPGAAPGNWPLTGLGGRTIQYVANFHWLSFSFQFLPNTTYKYWPRAFGSNGAHYDIDPKIVNQPDSSRGL
jgi:hypothetical protein